MFNGMMLANIPSAVPPSPPAVTVSGEIFTQVQPGAAGDAEVALRINADGTIDKRVGVGGSYVQIDAGTDWIIPNGDASANFEVKIEEISCSGCGSNTFQNPGGSGKGLSTWWTLGSSREWSIRRPASQTGVGVWDFTVHIREGSEGGALDTGDFTLTAGIT